MSLYDDFEKTVPNNLQVSYKPINIDEITQENNNYIDAHIHSKFSTDGYMDIDKIVTRCIENGVEWASITDHNSFTAIKQLREQEKSKAHHTYFEYDGVKIFTGTEVSCKMALSPNNNLKLHMLCYGFDTDTDNILLNMIDLKDKDYTRARYYPLFYLSQKNKCYNTSLKEFKEFAKDSANKEDFRGRINFKETVDFYTWKGINKEKIEQDLKCFDFDNPARDLVTINVVDLINATHASGGYCVIAHPTANFERHRKLFNRQQEEYNYYTTITNKLLEIGCDGIELVNKDDKLTRNYNNAFARAFIQSCGTDTHFIDKKNGKDIGQYKTSMNQQTLIFRMLELEKAKSENRPTKRQKHISNIPNQNTYIDFSQKL